MSAAKPSVDDLRIDPSDRRRRGRGKTWWVVGALLLLAATAWFFWPRQLPSVQVATAETVTEAVPPQSILEASGYVTARLQATVSSKVTGKVVEVLVEEGMRVEEGQILARLDDALERRQVALAEAQVAAAEASARETFVRLGEARITLGRTRNLVTEGVATQAALDRDQAAVDTLVAQLERGRENVAVAARQLALRRQLLEDLVIRAPFGGVAISKDAQPGEMISPVSAGGGFTRTGICTLVDMDSLEIEVDVSESYLNRVTPDQPAQAVLDAYGDWSIPTRVITTIPAADRQKATVKVRLGFETLDPRILPDMGVKVTFFDPDAPTGEAPRPRLVVPAAAIRDQEDESVRVLVVSGDRIEDRAVTLGGVLGDRREVLDGLEDGERVVISGPADLVDGVAVRVEGATEG